MLFFVFYSEDEIITCPYNEAHAILRSKMPVHMSKCVKNYNGPKLFKCPFNIMHQFKTKEALKAHYENGECIEYEINNKEV